MELPMQAAEEGMEARNKETIQASFKAWRDGTGRIFDLLAPDAKWTIVGNSPVSKTYHSRQEFLDAVIDPFNPRLSSRLIPTARGIYADGDMVIALFDGAGTARDGKPYRNTYSWSNGQKTQTTSGQSKIGSRHEEQEVVGAPG
jgi:ketosteroid isomerase-like protein